ncbi:hypothetical protein ElyMa_002206000 [Elysia marginata]|uniref:Uncharacterized protein n=1 Tax=Elysia marginata TaxID=1093978 RepID=A0AAV4FTZ0_9GAST|nr:hypothetical protein ElyMa_002206000 [Elysia marginata]
MSVMRDVRPCPTPNVPSVYLDGDKRPGLIPCFECFIHFRGVSGAAVTARVPDRLFVPCPCHCLVSRPQAADDTLACLDTDCWVNHEMKLGKTMGYF